MRTRPLAYLDARATLRRCFHRGRERRVAHIREQSVRHPGDARAEQRCSSHSADRVCFLFEGSRFSAMVKVTAGATPLTPPFTATAAPAPLPSPGPRVTWSIAGDRRHFRGTRHARNHCGSFSPDVQCRRRRTTERLRHLFSSLMRSLNSPWRLRSSGSRQKYFLCGGGDQSWRPRRKLIPHLRRGCVGSLRQ